MRVITALAVALGLYLTAVAGPASADAIGWRSISVSTSADQRPVTVALWYPAEDPGLAMRQVAMGPFSVRAAMGAPFAAGFRGLIVISHGAGGTELGHGRIAEALAERGYLVAALRHPGDNWQDSSLRTRTPDRYFPDRPGQVSRVVDALLGDAMLRQRIATDARGLRIGAIGHSAGGYTVLALAGAAFDGSRLVDHCNSHWDQDAIFCGMGGPKRTVARPEAASSVSMADPRFRAVAALSPVGVVFDPESLRRIAVPVSLWVAERDRFLVPRFHGQWVAEYLQQGVIHVVPNSWHFAFMDTPGVPIASPDGDLAADPPGFDRGAFLRQLGVDLARFFDDRL